MVFSFHRDRVNILILKVRINFQLIIIREPRLGLVVTVPEIVTVAGGRERKAQRVVGRVAAPV